MNLKLRETRQPNHVDSFFPDHYPARIVVRRGAVIVINVRVPCWQKDIFSVSCNVLLPFPF